MGLLPPARYARLQAVGDTRSMTHQRESAGTGCGSPGPASPAPTTTRWRRLRILLPALVGLVAVDWALGLHTDWRFETGNTWFAVIGAVMAGMSVPLRRRGGSTQRLDPVESTPEARSPEAGGPGAAVRTVAAA